MEERNLTISLQEAREWYKGSIKELRDLALKTFSKEELESSKWQRIKTWQDVLNYLDIAEDDTELLPFTACYAARVQTIREVLNDGMNLWEGDIWYPYFRIGSREKVEKYSNFICGKITLGESQLDLNVGSGANYVGNLDITCCDFPTASFGSLGCATKEIAEHFGKYFYFEILASWYGPKISK